MSAVDVSSNTAGKEAVDIPADSGVLYISWAESCSRSDQTARELGGKSSMVYLPVFGSHPLTILPKYFGQFLMTAWLLVRHRPKAVVVMSPPIVAAFAPFLYRLLTGRPFVMDCHTAAFMHPRWRRFQWLQHFLGRRSAINIVHNEHLKQLVESNGGRTVIVSDVPVIYESIDSYPLSSGFNVTVVCSFNPDEPIDEIVEACRSHPEMSFYMTGNPKHLDPEIQRRLPDNVTLTGFVPDEQYGDLLKRSNMVMSLTTRDHTMLRGAWEAIYQGTPVIVSDWPILKEAFSEGALHVDNSAESIAEAFGRAKSQETALRSGAERERVKRIERWNRTRQTLFEAIFKNKS